MTRKLKALGLALVAVLAMSAVAAAGAQAEEVKHQFKSETTPTNLTGFAENTHVFTINEGENVTTCEKIEFDGTKSGTEFDTVTIKPTYDECEIEPLGKAIVTENHCAYVFESDTTTHGTPPALHAPVDVECAEGDVIEIEAESVGVVVSVGAQVAKHGVQYTNVEDPKNGKEAVTVNATVREITWTCAPAFLCGLGGIPTSGSDGTYDGTAIVTGFVDNGPEPEKLTDTTTPDLNHGAAVNITMTTQE